jgi:hypothetical protein
MPGLLFAEADQESEGIENADFFELNQSLITFVQI